MLTNSVGSSYLTPDKTALSNGANHDIVTNGGKPGLMSVIIIADVNIHLSRTSPSSTNKFLIIANTPFEIPVADLAGFSVWATGAGSLYVFELLG